MEKKFTHVAAAATIKKIVSFASALVMLIGFSLTDASAQSVLLADIDDSEELTYNEYSALTAANGRAYFIGRGRELWTISPTGEDADKPKFLKKFTSISDLTVAGSNVYFVADDGTSGRELWKSNGTTGGTVRAKDIRPGAEGSTPASLTNVRGTIYFSADDGVNGRELWKSNGTPGGTALVRNILPGAGNGNPTQLAEMNGLLFFAANDGTNGIELWKSNGTAGGTVMVKDIRPGLRVNSSPSDLVNVYGTLFFVAAEATTGRELWKSDGTAAGTVRVKDIWPGTNPSRISNTTAVYRTLYFSAADGVHGIELWKSDGTEAGTVMVKDLTPGPAGSTSFQPFEYKISNFANMGGTLFFTAYQGDKYYIWKSNGTGAGTVPIIEVGGPGILDPVPMFTLLNNRIYFFNRDTDSYYNPVNFMSMDRGGADLQYITSFEQPDAYNGYYPEMALANSTLYLTGRPDYYYGFKLLKSDGTSGGTVWLDDISTQTEGSNPTQFTLYNGRMFFRANHAYYQQHNLWVTDGTPAGTSEFSGYDEEVTDLVLVGNNMFAPALLNFSLYRTDLTTRETEQLLPNGNSAIETMTVLQNTLYFGNERDGLWKTDGTREGTVQVIDVQGIRRIEAVGDRILMRLYVSGGALELWRSDGTASGTVKVKTIKPAPSYGYSDIPAVVIGDTYYFTASDGIHGEEVWKSNGTAAGTQMVKDLETTDNEYDSHIWRLFVYENSLYISAIGPDGQWGVYKSDGTSEGTQLLKHMPRISHTAVYDGRLYLFTLEEPTTHVWVSDGTSGGTSILKELPGNNAVFTHDVVDDVLYFVDLVRGTLWRTDGTACGTFAIDGVSNMGEMKALNNILIFAAYDSQTGEEPYAFDLSNAPESPCSPSVADAFAARSKDNSFTGYPNPFTNDMTVRIDDDSRGKAQVRVFTLYGKPVESIVGLDTNTELRLGQAWPKGVYVLEITRQDKVTRHVVVKE